MIRPNQVRSKPSDLASGKKIGAVSSILESGSMKLPRKMITPIMMNTICSGVTWNEVAHCTRPLDAPVNASTWAKVAEPKITRNAITVTRSEQYRDSYSNSVQVRMSVWDFFLIFGTMRQDAPDEVKVENFQGIYLSPQQAKALMTILEQNVIQYEKTFGEIKLDPSMSQAPGQIH